MEAIIFFCLFLRFFFWYLLRSTKIPLIFAQIFAIRKIYRKYCDCHRFFWFVFAIIFSVFFALRKNYRKVFALHKIFHKYLRYFYAVQKKCVILCVLFALFKIYKKYLRYFLRSANGMICIIKQIKFLCKHLHITDNSAIQFLQKYLGHCKYLKHCK